MSEPADEVPAKVDTPDAQPQAEQDQQPDQQKDVAEAPEVEPLTPDRENADENEYNPNEDSEPDIDSELHRLKSHRRAATERAASPAKKERRRKTARSSEDAPKRRRKAGRQESVDEEPVEEAEDELTRERRQIEEKIDAALKPGAKKRKKLAGDDIEAMQDEMIAGVRDRMREAALKDVDCIREAQPAIYKMRMLPEVVGVLQKSALAYSILDNNLLESVRIWLEPLPDASLPSFEIQKALFSALLHLPIKTIHLRESGLGRVVLFYQKSKRPQQVIKRMAQKLLGDWTRPIIGRSDNYRDMRVAETDFDPTAASAAMANAGLGRRNEPLSSYEESAARRGRAAIPTSSGTSYRVAPRNNVASFIQESGVPGSTRDAQLRRMKSKLMTSGRPGKKKSQVSVEGRGLN